MLELNRINGFFVRCSLILLFCFYVMLSAPMESRSAWEVKPPEGDFSDCMACHKGIEDISANHPFACATCHLHPKDRNTRPLTSHQAILRNPSDPGTVRRFCLPCHQREVEILEHSLHGSLAGVINQTRYLWGAQDTAAPAIYGIKGPLKPLPEPDFSKNPKKPKNLVDDFLRRRCLRCHIHTRGPGGIGLYRATGCAACHMHYNNDGCYRGKDRAISKSKPGFPTRHTMTRQIPNEQCLHCHHQNHVGADYEGLFEHDYSDDFRSPLVQGKLKPRSHGLDYHHLSKDVHSERGLWCIDCHTKEDVMGNGHSYSYEMEVPKRACRDCHGGFGGHLPDLSISAIGKASNGYYFISRNFGQKHPLPLFSATSPAHRIDAHGKVRCSACHAQWSYQDYGLSVMREEIIEDYKWIDRTVQGDPVMEKELKRHTEKDVVGYPVSTDWLSGEKRPGIWSMGWRFRRWEPMPLGVDQTGHFAVLRPRYQYLISAVNEMGQVSLDSIAPQRGDGSGRGWAFMPYVPHTVAPFGRGCFSCHRNRDSAGLGPEETPTVDTGLTIPSPPAVKAMRLLNAKEQKRLYQPGAKWHRERLRGLRKEN
jgi:hypothetical protein